MALSAVPIALAAYLLGLTPATAITIGLILAMSSTAFALQLLAERNELPTRFGRLAFAILFFQDIAAIPMLAVFPLLGGPETTIGGEDRRLEVALVVGLMGGIVFGGRILLRTVLKLVATTRSREVFTAMALLTVAGSALLVEAAGLSMALGAFLAGVLLAESEFRHQLEADIEPFKGILLGLFLIAVGMSIDVSLLIDRPFTVVGLTLGLLVFKGGVLYVVGRAARLNHDAALRLAVALPQGGEFAFVLFTAAFSAGLLEPSEANMLVLVVTLSMALTPFLVTLRDRVARRVEPESARDHEPLPGGENQLIVAGFGRFGQIVGRVLRAKRIPFTALDVSSHHIDFVSRFGNKVYYGDVTRPDLLRTAKADKAEIFVLAVDGIETSMRIAKLVHENFPNLKIFARAHDRTHAHRLMDLDAHVIRHETFLSALDLAGEVLKGLGCPIRRPTEWWNGSARSTRIGCGSSTRSIPTTRRRLPTPATKKRSWNSSLPKMPR
ncbi:MAG: glutathione-regulated potassium-efflux system protein KefB [Alphaproteobacteria bacterium]|nr:glutathione-regulated potassium-efflux system protein KefB [Alphaproteobacteria bacterium]